LSLAAAILEICWKSGEVVEIDVEERSVVYRLFCGAFESTAVQPFLCSGGLFFGQCDAHLNTIEQQQFAVFSCTFLSFVATLTCTFLMSLVAL
jgi:hypothetical protein